MENEQEELSKKVQLAIAELDKKYGANSVIRLGSADITPLPAISTGSIALDRALGIGGLARGRIIEIYGPESSGKSTISLSVVAEAQRQGGVCAYVDAEHAIDPVYAKSIGVDMDNLLFSQPDYGEMAMDTVLKLAGTGDLDVIVVDSVAALTPKAELEGEIGASHVGLMARLMSQLLRKLVAIADDTGTVIIFINQLREKIGVMFGNPETTPGGRALRFYSSVRIDLRKIGDVKDDKTGYIEGSKVKAKIVKNKTAPPLRLAEFEILYGRGVNNLGSIVDLAIETGLLKQSGAWIKYEGETIAQGRKNMIELLASDLDLAEKLQAEIL